MTDYIVKVADVSWSRHSISIVIGDFITKDQAHNGTWRVHGEFTEGEIEMMATTDLADMNGPGGPGLWITDDYMYDRFPIWRPPYSVSIKRIALLVSCAISADSDEYYDFEFLNSSDDTVIADCDTSSTGITVETPCEATVYSTNNTLLLTESLVMCIKDENAKNPIKGLCVVIDYEPSVGS